jgi:hypothetical protein
VGAAALPGRAGQDNTDGADGGVGGEQLDTGHAAGGQQTQERRPAGAVLTGGDVYRALSPGQRPGNSLRLHSVIFS